MRLDFHFDGPDGPRWLPAVVIGLIVLAVLGVTAIEVLS